MSSSRPSTLGSRAAVAGLTANIKVICLCHRESEDTLEEGSEASCHLPVGTAGSVVGVDRKQCELQEGINPHDALGWSEAL